MKPPCFLLLLLWAASPAQPLVAGEPVQPRLLIVAPEALAASLEDFAEFKRTQLPTTVETLESILSARDGADDPEKLKRRLYRGWRDENLGYVLLVGDVDVMPVRYIVTDRKTKAAFDYAFYPSDLYYSDVARQDGAFDDWNGQKEGFHAGYYGEVRGESNKTDPINFDNIDLRPDIAIGRWPVSTPEGVKLIAAKSADYERRAIAGDDPQQHRAALLAVGGWVDARRMMDGLAWRLGQHWRVDRNYYAGGRYQQELPEPTSKRVRTVFNEGAGLVLHAGHGQPNGWERCFFPKDLQRLAESRSMPVVYSASCSTARFAPLGPYTKYVDTEGVEHVGTDAGEEFDSPPPPPAPYQRGEYNFQCLGESLLTKPAAGAVAYIGCNTGSQPCGLVLMGGFVEKLGASPRPRLGDCWNHAVEHYHEHENLESIQPTESWYPASIFFQPMKFMVFGDPSLRMPGAEKVLQESGAAG